MASDCTSRSHNPKDILTDLYESKLLADVTIQLKGHKVRAHRAILAKSSAWFADKLVNDPEYESKLVINLQDDDAAAMKAMVCFCYTGTYDRHLRTRKSILDRSEDYRKNLALHINVHNVAEKYRVGSLRTYSLIMFNAEAMKLLNSWPYDLLPIIESAYNLRSESNAFRSAAVKIFNQYIAELENNTFLEKTRVKIALEEATKLFTQIAKDAEATMTEPKHKWDCFICKTTFEYAGKAKGGNLKGMMCPWCKAEKI